VAGSELSIAGRAAQLTEAASALDASLRSPLIAPAYLNVVLLAKNVDALAEEVLALSVQQSRDAGHTWQQIGDLLGVTRQAAFQRFGKPIDPRTGEPMDKTVHISDAGERATQIAADILGGRMNQARPLFNAEVAAAFTDEVRGNALAAVAGLVGAFEGIADAAPFVRRIGDHTVVDIPLRYEAGDMKARVAFDADAKVAGFFILAPEAP